MHRISFPTSNYVARQLGFSMPGGWSQGEAVANEYFAPVDTFAERFRDMLRQISSLGFHSIDLWTGHLNGSWATNEHVRLAREALDDQGLVVASLCGRVGERAEDFATTCQLAADLGAPLVASRYTTQLFLTQLPSFNSILDGNNLRLAVNCSPTDTGRVLDLLRSSDSSRSRLGTALDIGDFAAQGYDPVDAITKMASSLFYLRLRDVRGVGSTEDCELGSGIVDMGGCLGALRLINYNGPISVAHESVDYDPSAECAASLQKLQVWLG